MAMKGYSFRLEEGLVARVDALGVKRADFVRDAIEAALCGDGVMKPAEMDRVGGAPEMPPAPKKNSLKVPVKKVSTELRGADEKVLLSELRRQAMTSRDLERKMAWLGLRYSRAEKALLSSGLVVVVDGLMVVT